MKDIFRKFKHTRHGQILININLSLDALIYADDLTVLVTSQDALHTSRYYLQPLAMEISSENPEYDFL